jgi:papain like protease
MRPVRAYGYRPDRHDPRDFSLGRASGPAPVAASVWRPECLIKDQLQSSSCVGQAVSQALRLAYLYHGTECPELSALDVYEEARRLAGETADDGTEIRLAIKAVQKIGVCAESFWPMSMARVNLPLTPNAIRAGFDRRGVRRYYRIAAGDTAGVRRAIASGCPVVGGWSVTRGFEEWSATDAPIEAQRPPYLGGHAMAVVGYDHGVFMLANSWGPKWGAAGQCAVTEGFAARATDVWALDVRSP